ncbi:MAG: hypothetical protein J5771_04295 [Bacteroidales bacterium]|nr:hypothetical protein [Bacteroidales bacterium]
MKKVLAILFVLAGIALAANAQPRAIGVRFGYNFEASYQHEIGMQGNFIEFDAGYFPGYGIYGTGIYDFNLMDFDGTVVLYGGPGVTAGTGAFNDKHTGFDFGIAAQIGAEFNFPSIPLSLSLDWRPCWYFLDAGFIPFGLAFGVRYRF